MSAIIRANRFGAHMLSGLYLKIETVDLLAIGFAVLILGGILGTFFFYLRTAYKKGGWKRVGRDFVIAVVALFAFAIIRIIQNHQIGALKQTIDGWFHR